MRIPCPYCGERDSREFVFRGSAEHARPEDPEDQAAFFEYAYMRENPAGALREHWYHAQGCRTWLVVTRDTGDHAILAAELARPREGAE